MSEMDFKILSMWERDYKTLFTKKFANRKPYKAPNFKMALSFIPGTVREINVKEGQVIKKGDQMFLLESMKMLNIVRTPVDGKIKKIYVQISEKIPKNHLMVEFE